MEEIDICSYEGKWLLVWFDVVVIDVSFILLKIVLFVVFFFVVVLMSLLVLIKL